MKSIDLTTYVYKCCRVTDSEIEVHLLVSENLSKDLLKYDNIIYYEGRRYRILFFNITSNYKVAGSEEDFIDLELVLTPTQSQLREDKLKDLLK